MDLIPIHMLVDICKMNKIVYHKLRIAVPRLGRHFMIKANKIEMQKHFIKAYCFCKCRSIPIHESVGSCCWCRDMRNYTQQCHPKRYIDGKGLVATTIDVFYCPGCKVNGVNGNKKHNQHVAKHKRF